MHVVLCNCSEQESEALASDLVASGLAACVNLVRGVTSIYFWEGSLHRDKETTLIIKVASETLDAMCTRIREKHSYDTVEILVLDVNLDASDPDYVDWVRRACAGKGGKP
jgi:periplasmic divalent cation tolerance protein